MRSSSSSLSSYYYNTYGSSSMISSLMPLYSSSRYSSSLGLGSTSQFQGLSCLGRTGQDFLNCLQQYGVMSTPGSLLIQNGTTGGIPSLTCNQYTGSQLSLCQQQLTDWWRSYNASLQIWWTQLQQYINGLMAEAGISPSQVGTMTGSSMSSSSGPSQNAEAMRQYWQVCGQFDFPQQQRCMHDALTNYPRYQDWINNLQQMQATPNRYQSSSSSRRSLGSMSSRRFSSAMSSRWSSGTSSY